MTNPVIMMPRPFAQDGNKNPIQETPQPNQPPQDATLSTGFPPVTMIPKETGGIPPNGLDMNGILYLMSLDTVHRQKGERIQYDQDYATKIGGYSKGAILQSNDTTKEYISLVDSNTVDPNSSNIAGYWSVYAGQGSVPNATSTTVGLVKLINTLTSQATDAALTANQGKVLKDLIDALSLIVGNKLNTSSAFGIGQTYSDYTSQRSLGVTYTNNTSKPIEIQVGFPDSNGRPQVIVRVNNVIIIDNTYDSGGGFGSLQVTFTVPAGSSYSINVFNITVQPNLWAELR